MPISPSRITPPAPTSGASAPTASAGSNQTQNDTKVVTLDGSGSTSGAGVVVAWTLTDPEGTDQTSRLSSSSAVSPTFTPLDTPGVWVAEISVTQSGVTTKDSCTVRVGDGNGWIRMNANLATSTYTGSDYSTVTWSDDNANWTTLTLSPKLNAVNGPDDCEIKWFQPNIANIANLFSIEWKITGDDSYSLPPMTNWMFAGVIVSNTLSLASSVGMYHVYTICNSSSNTKTTCRGNQSSISWASTGSGYNSVQASLSYKPYEGRHERCTYYKTKTTSTHATMAPTSITFNPTVSGSDPLYLGMMCGRSGNTSGDKTIKFQIWYKINKR